MNEKNKDLIDEINVAAFFISQRNIPYDSLCWMFAEKKLFIKSPGEIPAEDNIRNNAAQMYFSCCEYDVLCWLIAELEILIKHERFDMD